MYTINTYVRLYHNDNPYIYQHLYSFFFFFFFFLSGGGEMHRARLWLICYCHSIFIGTSSSGFIYLYTTSLLSVGEMCSSLSCIVPEKNRFKVWNIVNAKHWRFIPCFENLMLKLDAWYHVLKVYVCWLGGRGGGGVFPFFWTNSWVYRLINK